MAKAAIAAGADANARDDKQLTLLHWAAYNGHTDIVRLLIDNGAEVTPENYNQWTPLHSAAFGGHTDIAQLLIDSGAEVNALNHRLWSTLHSAAFNSNNETNGNIETVGLLLSKGADPSLINDEGETARQIADRKKHKRISGLLAAAEVWHTHIKPLLGADNKLDVGQLVDADGQPTQVMKNMPNEACAALAKPGLYREGMDGVVKVMPHLPEAVQKTIDLTDWRLNKLKELETEPSAIQRYVRRRPSPLEKGRGNDDSQASKS